VVTEVRIYIEGGGDQRDNRTHMREAFGTFLSELRELARARRIRWNIIACGSRNDAYKDFCTGLAQHPDAFNVLLVDAEGAIEDTAKEYTKLPWRHLKDRDDWDQPHGAGHTQCFLMLECMETWLIADRDNLRAFYKSGFNVDALPATSARLERIPKAAIYQALKQATKNSKEEYHKTHHAFGILKTANPKIVREAAPHCKRLFDVLTAQITT
jgi:hypothetical protein